MKRIGKKEHQDCIDIILYAIRHDGIIYTQEVRQITANEDMPRELVEANLLIRTRKGEYEVNIEEVRRVSFIVTDEMYESMKCKSTNSKQNKKVHRESVATRQAHRKPLTSTNDPMDLANILLEGCEKK